VTTLGFGGLAVDGSGNLYFTESRKHRILKFTPAGVMSVFAGSGSLGAVDAVGTAASFNNPTDLAIDGSGNLFVSDTNNSAIRKITPGGVVTTVAKQLTPGAISVTQAGVVFFVAGSPRTLVRLSADLSRTVSFPLTGVTDSITGVATNAAGTTLYVGTQGVGAQILKLAF
jgi:sugar lactone lactonase YvrE